MNKQKCVTNHKTHCYDFVNIYQVSTGCQMWTVVQQESIREIETEFINHRSWRKFTPCLDRPHREVKVWCRQRETGLGVLAFIRVHWWVFCSSWAKTWLVNSNKKNSVLVSSTRVILKWYIKGRAWEVERLLITEVHEEVITGTKHLFVTLWAVI